MRLFAGFAYCGGLGSLFIFWEVSSPRPRPAPGLRGASPSPCPVWYPCAAHSRYLASRGPPFTRVWFGVISCCKAPPGPPAAPWFSPAPRVIRCWVARLLRPRSRPPPVPPFHPWVWVRPLVCRPAVWLPRVPWRVASLVAPAFPPCVSFPAALSSAFRRFTGFSPFPCPSCVFTWRRVPSSVVARPFSSVPVCPASGLLFVPRMSPSWVRPGGRGFPPCAAARPLWTTSLLPPSFSTCGSPFVGWAAAARAFAPSCFWL